ncbi:MAG: NAD-dependent malic enzyme [Chloroflexi bacterium]|nr:NAD-dependent malic enzyme [Chloroflexota bacterium]MBL7061139.1 NAD-dependent malic enzyme [Dehalococcoidia bacterium]
MDNPSYKIARTLRCKNANIPGTLGKLAKTIGRVGGDIGNITTVHLGHHYTVRDIEVLLDNKRHLEHLIDEVSKIKEVIVLEARDEVLDLHKGGKIKMVSTIPITSEDVLRRVYTPGVAEVCNLITDRPSNRDTYTSIAYSVAVVTDGTAILGLGNIGPVAGMPVMEGKAALLQQLVGISGIPILLDTTDPDEIVETVKHIAPTFGGIHLEDIASPRCFLIQDRLENELNIPVMHDDQQGTAVVVLAALINACKLTKLTLEEAKIGLIGLGAAGLAIGKFLLRYTGNPTLGVAKTEASVRRHAEQQGGIPSSFDEIMKTADIVIATSGVKGLIQPRMVRRGQIIFALSNPYPEIDPELARASGATLAVDGRAVNNLLGYPGIWRGTLDALANKITYEMYRAAALAIVCATSEGELVPNPLDPKAHLAVTHGVAKAAIESGVAQRPLDDDYFENTNIKEPPCV